MAKTRSFAEKMLKSMKPKEEHQTYRVLRPKITAQNTIRYESKIVKVHKDQNESEVLGLK